MIIVTDDKERFSDLRRIIHSQSTHHELSPLVNVITTLLAYNLGLKHGLNVDRPGILQNLSCTLIKIKSAGAKLATPKLIGLRMSHQMWGCELDNNYRKF